MTDKPVFNQDTIAAVLQNNPNIKREHLDVLARTAQSIASGSALIHRFNAKWWQDINTGEPIQRNVGECLALIHSEISEALEGHRKNKRDDHLPHRPSFEVELADALIRIFDLAAGLKCDLAGAFYEKNLYNLVRADHKHENRIKDDGKKY